MSDSRVPPLEAAARAAYLDAYGGVLSWEDASESIKTIWQKTTRAALEAAIEALPEGMDMGSPPTAPDAPGCEGCIVTRDEVRRAFGLEEETE